MQEEILFVSRALAHRPTVRGATTEKAIAIYSDRSMAVAKTIYGFSQAQDRTYL